MRRIALMCLALTALASCSSSSSDSPSSPSPSPNPPSSLKLTPIASGLSEPLFLTSPPGDSRLFVVEQTGRIRVIKDGKLLDAPFLDLSGSITTRGDEEGLLGLAFHPSFASNGRFFVHYTERSSGAIVIAEYHAASGSDVAESGGTVLLTIPHDKATNHNGGMLAFGPDGKLYDGAGDGGAGQSGNGQRTDVLLGKILRIDVDGAKPYAVPSDNPFANGGGRGEIWSFGLRNPWRFSFDRTTGDLYIGDVGELSREEIDVATAASGSGKGLNFGWDIMEGDVCSHGPSCDQAGLTPPVLVYDHSNGNCAVIGGYVYRGAAIPGLAGTYFYGDLCSGEVHSFTYQNGQATSQQSWSSLHTADITSFGQDAAGELYITARGGTVSRIDAGP
ncbi:MAG TPA: PQQ-dependent sugar dehydrogenase [Gemmatimonadales bacterium]|nr:PQQ-dependent sugar dehydrogenase [Gemmatimonadales bacterium]